MSNEKKGQGPDPKQSADDLKKKIIGSMKGYSGEQTSRWILNMDDDALLKGASERLTTTGEHNILNLDIRKLIDSLFDDFQRYVFEYQQTAAGSRFVLNCLRPTANEGPVAVQYGQEPILCQGHISTANWVMIVQGKAGKVCCYVVPVEFLVGFKATQNQFSPFMEVTALITKKGKTDWRIDDRSISQELLPIISKRIFGALIKVERGEAQNTDKFVFDPSEPEEEEEEFIEPVETRYAPQLLSETTGPSQQRTLAQQQQYQQPGFGHPQGNQQAPPQFQPNAQQSPAYQAQGASQQTPAYNPQRGAPVPVPAYQQQQGSSQQTPSYQVQPGAPMPVYQQQQTSSQQRPAYNPQPGPPQPMPAYQQQQGSSQQMPAYQQQQGSSQQMPAHQQQHSSSQQMPAHQQQMAAYQQQGVSQQNRQVQQPQQNPGSQQPHQPKQNPAYQQAQPSPIYQQPKQNPAYPQQNPAYQQPPQPQQPPQNQQNPAHRQPQQNPAHQQPQQNPAYQSQPDVSMKQIFDRNKAVVAATLDELVAKLDIELDSLARIGMKAIQSQDMASAQFTINRATRLKDVRQRVNDLSNEWKSSAS